jgi:hypothetical protein
MEQVKYKYLILYLYNSSFTYNSINTMLFGFMQQSANKQNDTISCLGIHFSLKSILVTVRLH